MQFICKIYFPTDCKIAKLKPLFKKGSRTAPKNYCPISLLPLISKIIEKVIHDQMQKYLDDYNILYGYISQASGNLILLIHVYLT